MVHLFGEDAYTHGMCKILVGSHQRCPKYAKYKEYRFKVVEGKQPTTPSTETIRSITKRFPWKSVGKPKQVSALPLPYFCDLCMAKRFDACGNKGYAGSWEQIDLRVK